LRYGNYRELTALKPNPKNPRKGTKGSVEKLAESIGKNPAFFEARPILLSDRTGELVIIGGERRSEAARLLGLEKVPTILIPNLTEEQEDEIMVRDNTHTGEWDAAKLAEIASSWGADTVSGWGTGVNWDAEQYVKSSIPELANLGEEKTLAEILDEEGKLARERVIITFPPERKAEVAKFLGMDAMKKVLYRFEELNV
jgi:hypothetical protein